MPCPHCGIEIAGDVRFCWKCGRAVDTSIGADASVSIDAETIVPHVLAGKPRRLAAYALDYMIILAGVMVVAFGIAIPMAMAGLDVEGEGFVMILYVIWAMGALGYFSLLEGSLSGATIGKSVLGIRVVAKDGGPITPGRAARRTLGRLIPFDPWVLLFSSRKQAIHDHVVGSLVVMRESVAREPDSSP